MNDQYVPQPTLLAAPGAAWLPAPRASASHGRVTAAARTRPCAAGTLSTLWHPSLAPCLSCHAVQSLTCSPANRVRCGRAPGCRRPARGPLPPPESEASSSLAPREDMEGPEGMWPPRELSPDPTLWNALGSCCSMPSSCCASSCAHASPGGGVGGTSGGQRAERAAAPLTAGTAESHASQQPSRPYAGQRAWQDL